MTRRTLRTAHVGAWTVTLEEVTEIGAIDSRKHWTAYATHDSGEHTIPPSPPRFTLPEQAMSEFERLCRVVGIEEGAS